MKIIKTRRVEKEKNAEEVRETAKEFGLMLGRKLPWYEGMKECYSLLFKGWRSRFSPQASILIGSDRSIEIVIPSEDFMPAVENLGKKLEEGFWEVVIKKDYI